MSMHVHLDLPRREALIGITWSSYDGLLPSNHYREIHAREVTLTIYLLFVIVTIGIRIES